MTDKKTNSNSSRSSYQFIENIVELNFVEKLMNQEVVSFDTETETLIIRNKTYWDLFFLGETYWIFYFI